MSLIQKAKKKKLPSEQFMDQETLSWIKKNKPKFKSKKINRNVFDCKKIFFYLNKFYPKDSWFVKIRAINTIHGIRHMMRVLIYAVIISDYLKLTQKTTYKLSVASAIHDLRRINDNTDPGHGQRAAEWFIKNNIRILNFFKLKMTKQDIEEIYYIIFFHAQDYQIILNDLNYLKYEKNINIFKTLDALDRYRLPKLKWWIDDRYLIFSPPSFCKEVAYELVSVSEELFLSNKNNKKCLTQSLRQVYHQYDF